MKMFKRFKKLFDYLRRIGLKKVNTEKINYKGEKRDAIKWQANNV